MRPTDRLISRPLVALAAALILAGSAGSALAATETLNFDGAHTRVGFSIRHFFTQVRGEFKNVTGTIALDQANLNASKVNVEIETASINTNNDRRDTHLRSGDFFDAEKNPKITFVSKTIAIKDNKGTMTGDLTMHGVTKPITLHVKLLTSPNESKHTRWSVTTDPLKRREFNLMFPQAAESMSGISQTVAINIEIEAVRAE